MNAILRKIPAHPGFLATTTAAIIIVALCLMFEPLWETNDDIAMSMIAHGYGLAAHSSPNLITSNILWGYLVSNIPTIHGVLGYSTATLAVMLLSAAATLYFLLRLGTDYLLALLIIILLMMRPILLPQFTVNAGLLTVAAIIGWQVYARVGGAGNLVLASLLAFFGYLIRDKEFLLVLAVALPLLPWQAMRKQRPIQLAFLALGAAIALATLVDRSAYDAPEWQSFTALHPAQPPWGDLLNFGAGEHLKQHPDVLARHGYSRNDIDLVANFFAVDPQIANPPALQAMLAEIGPLPMQQSSLQSGWAALEPLLGPILLPLALAACLLQIVHPNWRIALSWLLCLAALFAIGAIGRPGMLRVYWPLFALLLIAPLLLTQFHQAGRRRIALLLLLFACLGNAYLLLPSSWVYKQWSQQFRNNIRNLPVQTYISWANSFPYELAFPVLGSNPAIRNIAFYGLDSLTRAPFSVAYTEQIAGHGMVERLRTTGIAIIASPAKLEMLNLYCREHLHSQLRGTMLFQAPRLTVQQVRCNATE